jgi:hypothetical protein
MLHADSAGRAGPFMERAVRGYFPTADELVAHIDSMLIGMEWEEQKKFWSLMLSHPENRDARELCENALAVIQGLYAKVQRHRKPKRNGKRDALITMMKSRFGFTAGQIVEELKGKYPNLTDKQVNSVVSRERKKSP